MGIFLKNYALSIILFLLFAFSWGGQAISEWEIVKMEAEQHGQEAKTEEWVWHFAQSTFENWQSEYLQLLSFVILSTYFIHKSSPQSRDGDDEMQERLKRIEEKLDAFLRER